MSSLDRIIGRPGRERQAFWRGFRYMFIRFHLVALPPLIIWLLWTIIAKRIEP